MALELDMELTINTSDILALPQNDQSDVVMDETQLAEALITAILLAGITIVTIVGNILVILSVFNYKPLRSAQNFFIVSLAAADLTVAVLVLPLNIVYRLSNEWHFGLLVCKLWLTCDVLCCTASILNLCAIALDRYWAIHDPVNYAHKRTVNRVVFMIALVWVISGIICLPPLIWNDWELEYGDEIRCELFEDPLYIIYSSCGSFYIPLIIMTAVYYRIYKATRRRLRERAAKASQLVAASLQNHNGAVVHNGKLKGGKYHSSSISSGEKNHNMETACSNGMSCGNQVTIRNGLGNNHLSILTQELSKTSSFSTTSPLHQLAEEKQKISLSKERRAARVLGIIMGVFVVCWLPFFLMYVILPFCTSCYLPDRVKNLITWLGYVNSALNPIIYTIFNEDFRRAFVRLLKCM